MKIIYFLLAIWLIAFTLEAQAEPLYIDGVLLTKQDLYIINVPTCRSGGKALKAWQIRISGGHSRITNLVADYTNTQSDSFPINKVIPAGSTTDWFALPNTNICPERIRIRGTAQYGNTAFAELWGQFE